MADRFDLLVGLFGIGASPTGSSDPFGLRRAALGLVSILRAFPALRGITLRAGLEAAARQLSKQGIEVPASALDDVAEFTVRRYEQQLLDAGHDHRFVNAILPLANAPASADMTLAQLTQRAADPEFADLVTALQRVRRIVPPETKAGYALTQLSEPAEVTLHEALRKVRDALGGQPAGLTEFADTAKALTNPINTFFDDILVMAQDEAVRKARLGLLASVRDLGAGVLDWQALGTALTRGQ
jgi:glycyl-tRNA synthetase